MKKPYTFFFDIDGTILQKGKNSLSPAVTDALNFARSKGCKLFLNTGRTRAFVPYSLLKSECFDGFCCGCGTYVECNGQIIFENYLTTNQLIRITNEFKKLNLSGDLLFEGAERMYYVGPPSQWFVDNGFIGIESSDYFKSIKYLPKVNKFSTHLNDERREEFFTAISDEFYTMRFPNYCETVPLGFDKGRAIQITEELLKLDHDYTVAVGDSMNDEGMLRYAKTSVAMGNASDEVKAICNTVTDTADNDGVAKLIYNMLK